MKSEKPERHPIEAPNFPAARNRADALPLGTSGARPVVLPAYYLAEFDLTNAESFKPYAEGAAQTAIAHGGVYLARGGRTLTLEGDAPKRIVIIKFKSLAAAHDWYDSPEYAALRPHRQKSGITRNFVVEGFPD